MTNIVDNINWSSNWLSSGRPLPVHLEELKLLKFLFKDHCNLRNFCLKSNFLETVVKSCSSNLSWKRPSHALVTRSFYVTNYLWRSGWVTPGTRVTRGDQAERSSEWSVTNERPGVRRCDQSEGSWLWCQGRAWHETCEGGSRVGERRGVTVIVMAVALSQSGEGHQGHQEEIRVRTTSDQVPDMWT